MTAFAQKRMGSTLRDGPASLSELLMWPEHMLDEIMVHPPLRSALEANACDGIVVRTLYSGYENPMAALSYIEKAMESKGIACGGFTCIHAADILESRRKLLCAWASDKGPLHVFGDILDRLPKVVHDKLTELTPQYDLIKKARDPVKQQLMVHHAARQSEEIAKFLDLERKSIFNGDTKSFCYVHGQECPCCILQPPNRQDGQISLVVAGSCCQAWSSKGLQLGVAHPSFVVWLVFVAELKTLLPDMFLHEITPKFPHKLFDFFLSESYQLVIFKDICPTLLGHPVRRPRQFVMGFRRDVFKSTAQEQEFKQIFGRRVVLPGSVYFVAPDHEALLPKTLPWADRAMHVAAQMAGPSFQWAPGQFVVFLL